MDSKPIAKTFERKFTERIGVPPKLFARMVCFNKAIACKLGAPKQSWTSVAHALGYFDQMHLIKDFRLFTGETPSAFLRHLSPPTETLVVQTT